MAEMVNCEIIIVLRPLARDGKDSVESMRVYYGHSGAQ